jgi:hypothetical protein
VTQRKVRELIQGFTGDVISFQDANSTLHDGIIFPVRQEMVSSWKEDEYAHKAMNAYMSLIETMLSIFLMPSQCKTSGIKAWKRMSLTPAMSSVDLKYLSAESPPRLRKL